MTSSPGPPPGAPTPGEPSASDQPSKPKGANKTIVAIVLGVGVIGFVVVAGFIALVVSAGGPSAPAEYCTTASDLNAALTQDADLTLLQAITTKGEATAPTEIVGAWTQLDTALADLRAPQAQLLADEATDAIYNHWVKACN